MALSEKEEGKLKAMEADGLDTDELRAWAEGGRQGPKPPPRYRDRSYSAGEANTAFRPTDDVAAAQEHLRSYGIDPEAGGVAHAEANPLEEAARRAQALGSGFAQAITLGGWDKVNDMITPGYSRQYSRLRQEHPVSTALGQATPMLLAPAAGAALEGAELGTAASAGAQFLAGGGAGGQVARGGQALASRLLPNADAVSRLARPALGNIIGSGANAGVEALMGGAAPAEAATAAGEAVRSPENLALNVGTGLVPGAADEAADWIRRGPKGSLRERAARDIRTNETSGQALPKDASLLPEEMGARAEEYRRDLVRGLEDKGRRVGKANAAEEALVQRRLVAKHGGDPLIDVQPLLDEADKLIASGQVGRAQISRLKEKIDNIRSMASSLPTFDTHVPPESTTPGGVKSGGIGAVETGPMELQLLGRQAGEATEPGKATVRDVGTAPTILASPRGIEPTVRARRPRPSEPIPGGRAPEGVKAQDVVVQEQPGDPRTIDFHQGRGVGARPVETLRVDAPYKLPASHLENLIEELRVLGNEAAGIAKDSDKPFRRLGSVARSLRPPEYQAQQRRAYVRQNRQEQLYSDLGEGHIKTAGREAVDEVGGGSLGRAGGATEAAGAERARMERFRTQYHNEDRRLQAVPSGGPDVPAATMMRALEAARARQRLSFNPFAQGSTRALRFTEPVLGGAAYPLLRGLGNVDPTQAALALRPFFEAAEAESERRKRTARRTE